MAADIQAIIDKIDARLEAIADRTDLASKAAELMKMREMYQRVLENTPYEDIAPIDIDISLFGEDNSSVVGDES